MRLRKKVTQINHAQIYWFKINISYLKKKGIQHNLLSIETLHEKDIINNNNITLKYHINWL